MKRPIGKHADLVKQCLDLLRLYGALAWKTNVGASLVIGPDGKRRFTRYNAPGTPDIVGCLPDGRFIGVECKVGKDRLSDHQECFARAIRVRGGLFIAARDSTAAIEAELSYQGAKAQRGLNERD